MKPRFTLADVAIYIFLAIFCFMTVYPFWSIIVISFSTPEAYYGSQYHLVPQSFSLDAYAHNFAEPQLVNSFMISIIITVGGTVNSLFWTMIAGYFVSKRGLALTSIVFTLFLVTFFFDGGLIPNFVLIRQLGLRNSLLAVTIPFTINPFFLILMKNYFENRTKDVEEAATIDGAGEFTILFRIVAPTSKPILATIGLFYAVYYWNDWFWPMIYLSDNDLFPMALHLRNMISHASTLGIDPGVAQTQNPATIRAAAIVITILPIIAVYPFVQRYFVHGIMLGSSKE